MRKLPGLRNRQGGQVIIEYILMLVVVLTLGIMLQKFLKDQGFLKSLVFEPWGRLNGMVQCGTWTPCGVEVGAADLHPNTKSRILSYDPRFN